MQEPLYRNRHYNTPGHAHELTLSCYQNLPYFSDPVVCRIMLEEIENGRLEFNFDLWAYVIMPNHIHLLFWPKNHNYEISKIQHHINGRTSRRYSILVMENDPPRYESFKVTERGITQFRFWQPGGGFDRNLWKPLAIYDSIKYIENNPVRKGLIKNATDWEWSSAYAENCEYIRPVICRSSVPILMK